MKHQRSLSSITLATIVLVSLCAMCATTSVSAANSGNIQTSVAGNPIHEGSSPAVCSLDANSLDLFVRGADNACWWRHWYAATGWSAWRSLGGVLTSSPGSVFLPDANEIHVLVRGTNGALYDKWTWNGGGDWSAWTNRGGQLLAGTGPAACYLPGNMNVFVTGTNHVLYRNYLTYNSETSTWGVWSSVGGYLTSSPSAISSQYNAQIVVGVRGSNGAFYEEYSSDGGATWSGWRNYGGQILEGTGPCVGDGSTLVTGTNHQLYWFPGWTSLGGYLTSSPASTGRGGYIDVFVRGSNGLIYQKERDAMSYDWGGWSPMQGPP